MNETGTLQVEHLRRLAARLVDPQQTPSQRAAQAELLVQSVEDLRAGLRVATTVVPGSELIDRVRARAQVPSPVRAAAQERIAIREQIAALAEITEVRGVDVIPQGRPVAIPDVASTGLGAAPLIRVHGIPWSRFERPVVPGVVTPGDTEAAINPEPPVADVPSTITIDDVNDGAGTLDIAVIVATMSLQLVSAVDPNGAALIDNALRDLADLAAEAHAVAGLETAAGDTAAYVDAGTLDAAEGAAGAAGKGPAELLLVNPVDWPTIRRELGSSWAAGPHPIPVVTAGATAGTATNCGPGAFWLLVADYVEDEIVRPRHLVVEAGVVRPFRLFVRNADAIRTVTGIGA